MFVKSNISFFFSRRSAFACYANQILIPRAISHARIHRSLSHWRRRFRMRSFIHFDANATNKTFLRFVAETMVNKSDAFCFATSRTKLTFCVFFLSLSRSIVSTDGIENGDRIDRRQRRRYARSMQCLHCAQLMRGWTIIYTKKEEMQLKNSRIENDANRKKRCSTSANSFISKCLMKSRSENVVQK